MKSLTELTPRQLRKAADIQERIQTLQEQYHQLLGAPAPAAATPGGRKRKPRISAAGRAAISAAARARWARQRAGAPAKAKSKPKRKVSPAGRARLSALAKARWKQAKAAGRSKL